MDFPTIESFREITTLLTGVKDLVAPFLKGDEREKVATLVLETREKIISLQSQVLTAQSQAMELLEANRKLQTQLEDAGEKRRIREAWEKEAARYTLVQIDQLFYAYQLTAGYQPGDPKQYLCPQCFDKKLKSFLFRKERSHTAIYCQACGLLFHTHQTGPFN